MHLTSLLAGAVILCGLSSVSVSAGESGSSRPDAELVVVLNREPAVPTGGEIWLMDLRGRLVRRITANHYHEEHPRFSPDGQRLVFVRNLGGVAGSVGVDPKYNEIFVHDLRTGEERRLTRNEVEDGHPEWSYDGRRIAFHSRSGDPEGRAALWVMEADGSHARQVTFIAAGELSHTDPVWSPDGEWLVFVSLRQEGSVRFSRIEKVRRDGTQRTVVSSGGRGLAAAATGQVGPQGDLDPAPSPDGAMIWSARRQRSGETHLFAFGAGVYYGGKAELNMNGAHPPRVVERSPSFSPDGNRIVLGRSAMKAGPRNRQVVITDPQGSFRRFLTSREEWDVWHPSWHPFAQSGAERDGGGRVVTYGAKARDGDQPAGGDRLGASETAHLASTPAEPEDKMAAPPSGRVIGWRLDVAPQKVISLALRFEGKLKSDAERDGTITLQLMDWEENRWVSIFSQTEGTGGEIKIYHEISPANFIHPETQQVRLRLAVARSLAGAAPGLVTERVALDVRRE